MFWKQKEPEKIDNIMVIDAVRGVYFENQEDPDIIPMDCRSDGQEYGVLLRDNGSDTPMVLPDSTEYFDPQEYGNVLTMPAHKQLFERRHDFFKKAAPFALVLAMIVFGVLAVIAAG